MRAQEVEVTIQSGFKNATNVSNVIYFNDVPNVPTEKVFKQMIYYVNLFLQKYTRLRFDSMRGCLCLCPFFQEKFNLYSLRERKNFPTLKKHEV